MTAGRCRQRSCDTADTSRVQDVICRLQASITRTGFAPQRVFERLDTDADKRLSFDELMPFVLQLQGDLSFDERRKLFDKFDVDGSGDIDIREFCETLRQAASDTSRGVRADANSRHDARTSSVDTIAACRSCRDRSNSLTPLRTLVQDDSCRSQAQICEPHNAISIDSQTEIPNDLFQDLFYAGAQARSRGQHELRTTESVGQPVLTLPKDLPPFRSSMKAPPRLPTLLCDLAKQRELATRGYDPARQKYAGSAGKLSPAIRTNAAIHRSSSRLRSRSHSSYNAYVD